MSPRLGVAQKYATLLQVNRAAITQPGLNEILRATFGSMKKSISYDRVGVSLYAPEEGALKLAAADGACADSFYRLGLVLDCDATHHGWVFRKQSPILRRDLPRELEFDAEEPNVAEGIRSYCAVPLVIRGASIGVMIILSSQRNRYTSAHAEFLQEVSDLLVLGITSVAPQCAKHIRTRMICPRCIASGGGRSTAAKHGTRLSEWGRQGGRGRKKAAGGFAGDILS